MKTWTVSMIVLIMVLLSAPAAMGKTRIMFVMQIDRTKETIEADANLIANVIQHSDRGDHIAGITLDGAQVFDLSSNERNPLKARKRKAAALRKLKEFYLDLLDSHQDSGETDVAAGLRRSLERFNSEEEYERYLIVLFSSGLQNTKPIDLRNGR